MAAAASLRVPDLTPRAPLLPRQQEHAMTGCDNSELGAAPSGGIELLTARSSGCEAVALLLIFRRRCSFAPTSQLPSKTTTAVRVMRTTAVWVAATTAVWGRRQQGSVAATTVEGEQGDEGIE
uniref:Uncharacterized protein n=1 Tax=Oryza glumipatula TaxID=40148 RepID=A0A0D9Z8Y5_9ORYZ